MLHVGGGAHQRRKKIMKVQVVSGCNSFLFPHFLPQACFFLYRESGASKLTHGKHFQNIYAISGWITRGGFSGWFPAKLIKIYCNIAELYSWMSILTPRETTSLIMEFCLAFLVGGYRERKWWREKYGMGGLSCFSGTCN